MSTRKQKYRRVVAAALNTPWAILPHKLEQIAELLSLRAAGVRLTRAEIEARIGDAPRRNLLEERSQIAVLNLFGVIFPRADLMSEVSGGTSVERFGRAFDAAVADESVSAIVLNVDSPGGAVAGVEEVADRIFAARGTKPIVSVANYMMASAAYWLAAQADEIVAVKSATDVGSIGVFNLHREQSRADDAAGETYSVIRSVKFKADNNPHEPLTEAAREHLQSRVDSIHAKFIAAVARGRGIDAATVNANYGQGRSLLAEQALAAGLVDRIDTFEAVIARLGAKAADSPAKLSARHKPAFPSAIAASAGDPRFTSVRELIG